MIQQNAKQCPGCGIWLTMDDLMFSPSIVPQGMQIDPRAHTECYFQFAHQTDECCSSFLIHSSEIKHLCDLLAEERPQSNRFGCSGFCAEIHELANCRRPCSHSHYRQFLLSLWWTRSAAGRVNAHDGAQSGHRHHKSLESNAG